MHIMHQKYCCEQIWVCISSLCLDQRYIRTQIPALLTKWLITSHIQQLLCSEWNTSILCTILYSMLLLKIVCATVCIMPLNRSISSMPHCHMTLLSACLIQRVMVVSKIKWLFCIFFYISQVPHKFIFFSELWDVNSQLRGIKSKSQKINSQF